MRDSAADEGSVGVVVEGVDGVNGGAAAKVSDLEW
jgi:hypothetical protein